MERFDPMNDDSENRSECERLRNDPKWVQIYAFIRKDFYWHVTSQEGWRRIRTSGSIKPNVDGRYRTQFDNSHGSFGYLHDYVCLFDFVKPSEENVIQAWARCWDVLVDFKGHDKILLQLKRNRLEDEIVPNSEAFYEETGQFLGDCIPHVEVWYPKEIGTDCIKKVYIVPAPDKFEFHPRLFEEEEHG